MHFVKKVPTSEEEKAAKKKEHDKRSAQFLHARDRIVAKRDKNEYDDEMLSLTQAILEKNADIYTFWNIRRDTIEQRIAKHKEFSADIDALEEEKAKSKQKIDNLLAGELFLSYECIKSNPKSYSAWYQRAWVLQRQDAPDFVKELALCEKALQLDCRNFHCWDHRRTVAKMAKRTEEQELEFSNKLIEDNFSNYSAWHYRAIALKNIHRDEKTGSVRLDDSIVSNELQKVKNAFYMDADDQSAWTYTRWLLENGSGKEFLRPDSTTPIELITASFHGTNTTLVFSRAVTLELLLTFVDTEDTSNWKAFSSTSPSPTSAKVWQYQSETPLRVVTNSSAPEDVESWLSISSAPYINTARIKTIFNVEEAKEPAYIAELLADCQQLIELEPKNKWPLYMKTLILIEYRPIQSHVEIDLALKSLASELDPKRAELYKSLLSRQNISFCVREQFDRILSRESDELIIRYSMLTSLEGLEFLAGLVGSADFSGNNLEKIERMVLPNLKHLTVNENPIKSFSPSPALAHLEFLSIASTQVSNVEDVMPLLQNLKNLTRLVFCETPLAEHAVQLKEQLPNVRLIKEWL